MFKITHGTNPPQITISDPQQPGGREPYVTRDYEEALTLTIDLITALHKAWPTK